MKLKKISFKIKLEKINIVFFCFFFQVLFINFKNLFENDDFYGTLVKTKKEDVEFNFIAF